MAGTKALNVRMNFQVDTTQARQQIQQLGAQLNSITKASSFSANSSLGITQEILQATKAAAQLKTALAEAVNPLTGNLNLSAFNDQLIASKMSLMDYRNQLSALGTTGNQAFNSLTRSIMTAETPLLRTGKAAQQMWTVLGNTVRWQATSSMLHGIMSTASQAMNYVKSLDSSLNSIRIVTGQNQAQMERFAQTANKAAKELNTSTNAYAKASLIYYQQGLSNAEVEKRVATTVKLANVSGQTAQKVSDQLTAVWNNFYDGSKSLEYYADVMTALGASTASSTDEIAKGLEKFSAIAKTTGLSYEYATSALSTVVAATRQSADSVGTSFKTLFSRLQGLSLGETLDDGTTLNKYSKALNTIGVNIKNANGSLKDMDDILDEIGNKWTSLSKAEQVALAQTVGGARNYTGLVSLMDNWDSFQTNLKTAQQAQGTLQNQADIYAESWEAASNHVKVASETIYKNLLDDKFFKGMTNMFGYMLDGIGEVTNQMGGFKGVMSGLANFAFTTFAPQISKSFANIGASIYGFTPQGQERVLDLRKQAMNAVTSNVRLSRYDSVDQLAHSYNKAFVDRQVAYDNAVSQGRISEYQQPVYQQLFTSISQQEDATIQAAEQAASNKNLYDTQYGQTMTAVQAAINARYDRLRKEFDNISPEQLAKITSTQAGAARFQAYNNWKDGNLLTAKQLEFDINTYAKAVGLETQTADLRSYYAKQNGNYSLSSIDDMRIVANRLYGLSAAAKTSKQPLDDVIVGLGAFDKTLNGFGKNISELTDDELKQLFDGTLIDKTLALQAQNFDAKTVGSEMIKARIENGIRDALGLQPGEKSDVVSETFKALTTKGVSREEQAKLLSQIGIDKEKQLALLGDIEGQAVPKTISMSSALATNLGALASLGQIVTSTTTAIKTFGDENATAGQQIASLTSLAMAGSMAIKPFGNFIKSAKDQVTVFSKELGITNGALGGITLGLTAAAIATSAILKEQQKVNIEGQIKSLNTSIAVSQQLTADATAAYETLLSGETTHDNLTSKLAILKKGTTEFTATLLEANEVANSLIETGSLIYGEDYFYDENGLINFQPDALKQAEEEALELRKERQAGQTQLQIARNTLQYYHSYVSDLSSIGGYQIYNLPYIQQALTTIGKDKNSSINIGVGDILTAILKEASDKGVTQFNSENLNILQTGLNNVLPKLGTFDLSNEEFQNSLINMTMSSSIEEAYAKLSDAANYLKSQNINGGWFVNQQFENLAPEDQFFIASLFNPEAMKQVQVNGQNSIDTVLSDMGLTTSAKDFINFTISSNPDFAKNMLSLYSTATLAGTQSLGEGVLYGESPRDWYQQLYGKMADASYTDEQVDALVQQKLIQDILLNGTGKYTNLKQLDNFTSINSLLEKFSELNIPDIGNLNMKGIVRNFAQLKQGKTSEEADFIESQKQYAKNLYEQLQGNIQEGLLVNFRDSQLDTTINNEEFRNYAASVIGELNYNNLKLVENAIGSANILGKESVDQLVQTLQEDTKQRGKGGTELTFSTKEFLENYSFEKSLSGIYSNTQLARFLKDSDTRTKVENQLIADIKAAGEEKGLFEMLYNSSGFEDVMSNLKDIFIETGNISAANIEKIASKQENLNELLGIGAEAITDLNLNSAGLASVFEEVTKGTLGLKDVSSSLISSLSISKQGESLDQRALAYASNLDLGASSSEFLDYFQEIGKAYYQAEKANWGFNSEQMRNMISLLGNDEIKNAYYQANRSGEIKFPELMKQLPSYFTDFLNTEAGKKGKGGGGPADLFSFLYSAVGGAEMSEEDWNALGFKINEDGSLIVGTGMTQDMVIDNLKGLLMRNGYSEEAATQVATNAAAIAHQSGNIGASMDDAAAELGLQILSGKKLSQSKIDEYKASHEGKIDYKADIYEGNNKEVTTATDTDLKAYINQNREWIKNNISDEYSLFNQDGTINMSEAERWFLDQNIGNQNLLYLHDLSTYFSENKGTGSLTGLMNAQTGKEYTINQQGRSQQAEQDFKDLASKYGAFNNETGNWDYDKLIQFIEAQGGTAGDLATIIQQNFDLFKDTLIGHDINGKPIALGSKGYETWQKFTGGLQTGGPVSDYIIPYLANDTAASIYSAYQGMYYKNTAGEYEMDLDGSKRAAASELKSMLNTLQTTEDPLEYQNTKTAIERFITTNLANNNLDTGILKEYGYTSPQIEGGYESPEDAIQRLTEARNEALKFGAKESAFTYQQELEKIPEYKEAKEKYDKALNELLGNEEGTSEEDSDALAAAIEEKEEYERITGVPISPLTGDINHPPENVTPSPIFALNPYDAFQTFRDNIWGNQGVSSYFSPDITAEEEDKFDKLMREVIDANFINQNFDEELGEKLGITKEEAEQNALNAQESADLYKYQNMMSPAERLAAITDAQAILHTEGEDKLTPFQKFLMNSIGEIVDYQGIMADATEESDEAARKAKQAQVNEEGELVDEEGNPIELPTSQPAGGKNTSSTGVDTGGGGTKPPSGKTTVFPNGMIQNNETGQIAMPDGKGGWTIVDDPNNIDWDGNQNRSNSQMNIPGMDGKAASGQNNARILGFASGKEGHIAITGELGPELRVKSDGSMDLLGKSGREYTWVEPSDRIYTAAQTTSILGNNNSIPQLEALAKGINNFVPGYVDGAHSDWNNSGSSGGGGGRNGSSGGGGKGDKDPRYDPNILKMRDILERYYTILQKIDDITRAVENFAKAADRAWGRDRIKQLTAQTTMMQKQYDAQKKYVSEISQYLDTDKNALTSMITDFVKEYNEGKDKQDQLKLTGAQFDENGVLVNYKEIIEQLVKQYNSNAEANAQNKEEQYKFQERLKDIQQYTETLNLWEAETDKLTDLAHQILDNTLKTITYRVEYEIELANDEKALLNIKDMFAKDDPFRIAEHLTNLSESISNTSEQIEIVQKGLYDYLIGLGGKNNTALNLGPERTKQDLGLVDKEGKAVDKINLNDTTKKLDQWIADIRKKDEEAAKEIEKYIQRNSKGQIVNYETVLEQINRVSQQANKKAIDMLLNDTKKFFETMSDISKNPDWKGIPAEAITKITEYREQLKTLTEQAQSDFNDIIKSIGDSAKAFGKKIDAEVNEYDYFDSVYKSLKNIADLTNNGLTGITSEFFKELNSKSVDNAINKITSTTRAYNILQAKLKDVQTQYKMMLDLRDQQTEGSEEYKYYQTAADNFKEQLDTVNAEVETAHKNMLSSWEDALSKIAEVYKDNMENASKNFEKALSPFFNTLALLQAQFDREKALGDLYVDNYQKLHDLSKLNRDIDKSITDTDNLKSKARLRDLQKEITKLQEDGTDLSEYDLDILDKKYKLELARQALEDARDAKSIVRLSRDNNGNWGYVYTADEDEIADAEQDYENAIRDMEQANEDYIKNIQDQILQVQQEAQQAILSLSPDDFDTYEQYLAVIQDIQKQMFTTIDYLKDQGKNVFGNQQYLELNIPGIINKDQLTSGFEDTPIAKLFGINNLDQLINNAKNNLVENLIKPALEAYTEYSEKQAEAAKAAGYPIETLKEQFKQDLDEIADKSNKQIDIIDTLVDRIDNEFSAAIEEAGNGIQTWIDKNLELVQTLMQVSTAIKTLKELDGENVVKDTIVRNGDDKIDTEAEYERFYNALRDNGFIRFITTDKNGKETATRYEYGSAEAKQAITQAKENVGLGLAPIDVGEDGIDDKEYNSIKERFDKWGVVKVKGKTDGKEWTETITSLDQLEKLKKDKTHTSPSNNNNNDYDPNAGQGVKFWDSNGAPHYYLSGGYTGRWQSASTGMYTGEWPGGSITSNGRLAMLHQKELVLNAHDTENFLDAMDIVRQLDFLAKMKANGLGDLITPNVNAEQGELEQNVHIDASFPNVQNHNEIEEAFTNLVNMASQYAYRKA